MSIELEILKKNKDLIENLYQYMKKNLQFNEDASISFLINKSNADEPLGKTAYYSPQENKVSVYILNRHIKDILRSIAHELVHHSQKCRGEFNNNSETGDNYAQEDPHLRMMEEEAYTKGNMLFRDFEDGIKSIQKGNI